MSSTAGRTARDPHPTDTRLRRSPFAVIGVLVAACALTLGLTSCGGTAQAGGSARSADVVSWTDSRAGAEAVERQADAQRAAVNEAARVSAAAAAERSAADKAGAVAVQGESARPGGAPAAEPEQCTWQPEDRAACTTPEGAEVTPGGGDVDGDGVFEEDEPLGPGYKDPRAYDGGPTSGEVQCEWARQQGYGC